MRSYDVNVDVTRRTDLPGELWTAATVHLPDHIDGPVTAFFGFPGGGFGRKYYDVRLIPGYSQAEYHTAAGLIFVACDHLFVGDSSRPDDPLALTYENLAAANHVTVEHIAARLGAGTLAPGVSPIDVTKVVGMGQSMGGCLLTVQQARHRTFDGVAFLGWSGIYTNFPAPDGSRITYPLPRRGTDLHPIADQVLGVVSPDEEHFRFCFHWQDEEPELMEADLATYRPFSGVARGDSKTPWGSLTTPPCAITMMTEGAVTTDAVAIDVPVLIASGERDVIPDPRAEPSAYRSSSNISLVVVPRMGHMHNFARTREQLWEHIAAFARTVPKAKAT
ncbi:alpha/beta hydrolase [Frankia sp. Cppng1_Ct_nod]|uniref:alpha/beta hydrolase n=1 Tax=Frankia sp. Cppng1_Ct_nod TaxID=2897162 RepID=UPI001041074F|nr:alpha/beta hydrolase [Frankia sp. Cppng1_Ct_nod]